MTLAQWAEHGWLGPHTTSHEEVGNLLGIVDRDLDDAEGNISADWRFGIAYNAALKLCTVLLYASGYRPERNLAHYRTLQCLPVVLREKRKADVAYLDACRVKRNTVEYDYVGGASDSDANELIAFAEELRAEVLGWLESEHPDLL